MQGIIISVVIAIIGAFGVPSIMVSVFPRLITSINSFNIANSLFAVIMWATISACIGIPLMLIALILSVLLNRKLRKTPFFQKIEIRTAHKFTRHLEKRAQEDEHRMHSV
jgi:hypothetical protein